MQGRLACVSLWGLAAGSPTPDNEPPSASACGGAVGDGVAAAGPVRVPITLRQRLVGPSRYGQRPPEPTIHGDRRRHRRLGTAPAPRCPNSSRGSASPQLCPHQRTKAACGCRSARHPGGFPRPTAASRRGCRQYRPARSCQPPATEPRRLAHEIVVVSKDHPQPTHHSTIAIRTASWSAAHTIRSIGACHSVLHQPHHACLRRAGRCGPLGSWHRRWPGIRIRGRDPRSAPMR